MASWTLVLYPAPTDSWLVSESLVTETYRPFHPAETPPPGQEWGWSLLCSPNECRSCHTTQRNCELDPTQSYNLVWGFVCSAVFSWVSPSWYPPCLLPWGTPITGCESLSRSVGWWMNLQGVFDVMATLLACTRECKDLGSLDEATLIKPQNLFFFIVMYSSTFLFSSSWYVMLLCLQHLAFMF